MPNKQSKNKKVRSWKAFAVMNHAIGNWESKVYVMTAYKNKEQAEYHVGDGSRLKMMQVEIRPVTPITKGRKSKCSK